MNELNKTIEYYNNNSKKFISNTLNLEMDSLYEPFLKEIKNGGKILDAGCGPGRDTKNFLELGFDVTAFDASKEMVKIATEITGIKISQLKFDEITFTNVFDGIWACASLLHVTNSQIRQTIHRLSAALKNNGVFYLSFKYGEEEIFRNGRLFSNYTEKTFTKLISEFPEFQIINLWKTTDIRPGRNNEHWLNILLKKI